MTCIRRINRQKPGANAICYKDVRLEIGYRIDLIVNDKVLIEVKSIESLAPVHYAQTLTYLKLSGLKLGLLINFNVKILKDSIHRIVNNYNFTAYRIDLFAVFANSPLRSLRENAFSFQPHTLSRHP